MKKFVVANWKLNPKTLGDARKLLSSAKRLAGKYKKVETVICPPLVYLAPLFRAYGGRALKPGAQDIFWENEGAYTGQTSPRSVKSIGCKYAIVGHSEKRDVGDTNEYVNRKVRAALEAGLRVILCVGEKTRDENAEHLSFIKEEVESAFDGVENKRLRDIAIAYEPIWAIGHSAERAMDAHGIYQMSLFIKKIIFEKYGKKEAEKIVILYGGSVEGGNAAEILEYGGVNGFLVGHAGLVPEEFKNILEIANGF